jgi:hypothetical protein
MSSGTKESDAYHLAEERGCYVFAMRNRGLNPIYVGKATRCFKQETLIRGTDTNTAAAAAITARELRLCTSSFTLPKEAGRTLSRSVPAIRFETGSFDVVGKGELRRSKK